MLAADHVYFPLASNIEYFDTGGTRLDLEARIKQMALLANVIVFEPGLLTMEVAGAVVNPSYQGPDEITEDDIRAYRESALEGEPFGLFIGVQSAKGVPAPPEAMHRVAGGPIQKAYVAEYHLLA